MYSQIAEDSDKAKSSCMSVGIRRVIDVAAKARCPHYEIYVVIPGRGLLPANPESRGLCGVAWYGARV